MTAESGVISVEAGRRRIDELDGRIIGLLRQRRELSLGIQRMRVDAGEERIQPAREKEIRAHYRRVLGSAGEPVAVAMLELCRGRP